jgi:hypothetical protein
MSTKTIGLILLVLGVLFVVVSVAADRLGIGNSMGFGWKQQLGSVIGVILVIAGVVFTLRKAGKAKNNT